MPPCINASGEFIPSAGIYTIFSTDFIYARKVLIILQV